MPIIESLLDDDFYKFTMGQVVFSHYRDVPVKFAFRNRTKGIKLADVIQEKDLQKELDYVRTLRFSKSEIHYLRGTDEYGDRMFGESYLQFLSELELPPYILRKVDDNYELEFSGKWSEAMYWEIHALAIINELYFRGLMNQLSQFENDAVYAQGTLRLAEKIKILRQHPDITFSDFGTRRRFSRDWQDYVVKILKQELPEMQFLGTSNTYLAMKYAMLPMGTAAHEMDMGVSGVMHENEDAIRASHNKVLQDWWQQYGEGLSIALTDTYGTDFFFQDMTYEQACNWIGLRQDSGDPFEFVDKTRTFYKGHGLDPQKKLIVFSDGLDIETIVKLADYCRDRIKYTFGWGTNLTNDLGFRALSLIVKLMESNGHGTVKLSDNLAKALGTLEDVEHFKQIFGYTRTTYKEVRY